MQNVCTQCNAHWLHSNPEENKRSIYEFRVSVTVNVVLDHFLQKCGHQHRTHGLRDCCFHRLQPKQKFQEGLVGGGGQTNKLIVCGGMDIFWSKILKLQMIVLVVSG